MIEQKKKGYAAMIIKSHASMNKQKKTPPKGKNPAFTPSPSKNSRATSSGTIQPAEATDPSETFESYLNATSSRGEY